MDFNLNNPMRLWKSDSFCQTSRQTPSTTSSHLPSISSDTHGTTVATELSPDIPTSPIMSAKNASLDERFEWILECAQATGFESFDAMVTAYYNASFGESSPLGNEQRMSRNRRLPRVIADVFHAASQWSDWERRGFHEEILKTTETMLFSEGDSARNTLKVGINPLIEAQNYTNLNTTVQAITVMKKMIQNEVSV